MTKSKKRKTKPTTISEKVFAHFLPLPNTELFKLTVSAIAEKLGLTRNILTTTFKNETGHNLSDILENHKLLVFSVLILKPEYQKVPITAILESFNLGRPDHFARRFKKFFPVTPSVYRQLRKKVQHRGHR